MMKDVRETVLLSLFRRLTPSAQMSLIDRIDAIVSRQDFHLNQMEHRRYLAASAAALAKRDQKFRAFLARLTTLDSA
jgi:hypothetical protein